MENNYKIESEETLHQLVESLKAGLKNLRQRINEKEENAKELITVYYSDTNLCLNQLETEFNYLIEMLFSQRNMMVDNMNYIDSLETNIKILTDKLTAITK